MQNEIDFNPVEKSNFKKIQVNIVYKSLLKDWTFQGFAERLNISRVLWKIAQFQKINREFSDKYWGKIQPPLFDLQTQIQNSSRRDKKTEFLQDLRWDSLLIFLFADRIHCLHDFVSVLGRVQQRDGDDIHFNTLLILPRILYNLQTHVVPCPAWILERLLNPVLGLRIRFLLHPVMMHIGSRDT